MFGSFTGDEHFYLVLGIGSASSTPSTYVASETDSSGATGSVNTNQGNFGQAFVDTGSMGTGGFQNQVTHTQFLSGSTSGTTYYFNTWAGAANHGTGAGHFVSTVNMGVFRQHV